MIASSSASSSSSRNDVFSAPSPVMRPAPRLPSVRPPGMDKLVPLQTSAITQPQHSQPTHPPPPSKQAGFFFTPSSSTPSSIAPSPALPAMNVPLDPYPRNGGDVLPAATATEADEHADRPGYGRSNIEERQRERERIRQTNLDVEFRMCPVKEFMLGEGRHSNVYLGAYRSKQAFERRRRRASSRAFRFDEESANTDEHYDADENGQSSGWTLCALKRPHADRNSQLLALEEAFALRRLGPHPSIVKLICIRDEVELSPASTATGSFFATGMLGRGLPSGLVAPSSPSTHARSTSDTYAAEQDAKSRSHHHDDATQHRRLVSQPLAALEGSSTHVTIHTPQDDDASAHSRTSSLESGFLPTITEPPRLLMLMELMPFNLSSFARRNPELVDYEQWRAWALELAEVVEWIHDRGCIHADLKPENVLLTSNLHVKICDFNSAIFPNPNTPLTDGMGLGTPAYGAPELSQGGFAGRGSAGQHKGFSFPVDVWSLGAILYSLATGVEPFRQARSMIDMLYRKRVFFESEENDRVARMSVAEGSSTTGPGSHYGGMGSGQNSLPASRRSSLRGRKSDASALPASSSMPFARKQQQQAQTQTQTQTQSSSSPSHPTSMHRRAPSTESVSSVASSVVLGGNSTSRRPSVQAISFLLDENTPIGVFVPPAGLSTQRALRSLSISSTSSSVGTPGGAGEVALSPVIKTMRLGNTATYPNVNGHHRASSMGKQQGSHFLSPRSAQQTLNEHANDSVLSVSGATTTGNTSLPIPHAAMQKVLHAAVRPDYLRRTTSYTGLESSEVHPQQQQQQHQHQHHHQQPQHSAGVQTEERGTMTSSTPDQISPVTPVKLDNNELRLAVAAAFARSHKEKQHREEGNEHVGDAAPQVIATTLTRDAPTRQDSVARSSTCSTLSTPPSPSSSSSSAAPHEDDWTPYKDGSPALILPGGGRLPAGARALLERMLNVDPARRPTAAEVRRTLEAL